MPTTLDAIGLLSGLLLVFLVVIAEAYWAEFREFYFKSLDRSFPDKERKKFLQNFRRARMMFRIVSLGMLLSLIATVISVLFPNSVTLRIASIVLLILSGVIAVFLFLMTMNRFFVIYPSADEIEDTIELESDMDTKIDEDS